MDLWIYSPLLDLVRFFSFLIFCTVGRTPWTGDQPVARPLPAHRTAQRINANRHPCLKRDSNPRSQGSSGRRQFLERGVNSSQGRYLHNHRINAHTNIHASSGIRTHDRSVRAGENSSLNGESALRKGATYTNTA
jgi:hypothetical protein